MRRYRRRAAEVLRLHVLGHSERQISTLVQYNRSQVKEILADFQCVFAELKNIDVYKRMRGDILTAAELAILRSMMDPTKLEKAQLNTAGYAYKVIHDARRLEEGKSTSNSEVHSSFKSVTPTKYKTPDK